jgi:hypothetical protein
MKNTIVSETDVLNATISWLKQNDWKISAISLPRGQKEIYLPQQKQEMILFLSNIQIDYTTIKFDHSGPDIIATKNNIKWHIECKGFSGEAKGATQRNNFDRALSSAVSYYDNEDLWIGLSLPNSYKKEVGKRISQSLRRKINLSIFFYDHETKTVEYIDPTVGQMEMQHGGSIKDF